MISAQNKCTSLVCSCYVPSRNSDFKLEEEEEEEGNSTSRNQSFAENKNGSELMEEQEQEIKNSNNCQEKIVNGSSNCHYNGWSHIGQQQPTSIKSNLKRSTRTTTATTVVVEDNEQKRKVSWPDAHGKDIALVHEFETSLSEDGELEGVRNSCVCTIQ